MKKVYLLLEDNGSVLGYSKEPLDNTVGILVPEEFLDPEVFNHYYVENDLLIKMSDEEFKERRPYHNKPILSKEQLLAAQKDVLARRNSNLEGCVMELADLCYELQSRISELEKKG